MSTTGDDRSTASAPWPRWTDGVAAVIVAGAIAAFFWQIHHYGVNAVYADQWDNVTVVSHSYSGTLSFATLWAQHNENRILVPNLIVVGLAHLTRYNIMAQLYLSAVMTVGASGLLLWAHQRRSRATPWLLYCPVVLMLLSFVQYGNTLSGFQLAWCLVMLALATAVFFLDVPTLGWPILACAIAAAVVGSFSSLQGLLIWPAGLVLLYHRRRPRRLVGGWVVAAVVTTALYFHGYDSHQGVVGGYGYSLSHPIAAAKFFLLAIGDVVGVVQPTSDTTAVIVLGCVIFVIAVAVLLVYGIRRNTSGASPIGISLICFGLLFAGTITEGRAGFGLWAAGESRYATFDLLIPVGCYLALLERPAWLPASIRPTKGLSLRDDGEVTSARRSFEPSRARGAMVIVLMRVALAGAIGLQIVLGLANGLSGSQAAQQFLFRSADVLVNIDRAQDSQVQYCLSPFESPGEVRRQAAFLKEHGLAVFGGQEETKYAKEGLKPSLSCA